MTTMKFVNTPKPLCFCCHPPRIRVSSRVASTPALRPLRYKALRLIEKPSARGHRSIHIVNAGTSEDQAVQLKEFAATPIFKYWIQGAVFLVVLAGVDAAYSGDWSRVGVISKDFENGLKPLVVALGVFHIGCAVVAGRSAASKNIPVPPAVLKVLAVGFLAMVEVLLADSRPEKKQ